MPVFDLGEDECSVNAWEVSNTLILYVNYSRKIVNANNDSFGNTSHNASVNI